MLCFISQHFSPLARAQDALAPACGTKMAGLGPRIRQAMAEALVRVCLAWLCVASRGSRGIVLHAVHRQERLGGSWWSHCWRRSTSSRCACKLSCGQGASLVMDAGTVSLTQCEA